MQTDPDLPLTWERCHPASRGLLLDALVWDLVDEAGPNANEPGLAALEHLARAITTKTDPPTETTDTQLHDTLRTLLREADLNDAIPSQTPETTNTTPIADDQLSHHAITRDDTLLGYAFASLKLIGRCPTPLLSAACHAIDRQNDPAMIALRAPEDPQRFIAQRTALKTILECANLTNNPNP